MPAPRSSRRDRRSHRLLVGLAQGIAVAVARANPIITTIAASSIIMGIGAFYSGGLTVAGRGDAGWLAVGAAAPSVPNQIVFAAFAVAVHLAVQHT